MRETRRKSSPARAGRPAKEVDWEEEIKAILKGELKRRSVTYAELAQRFGKLGTPMTEPTLRNKISRGSFSAVFLLQCLAAIGCTNVNVRVHAEPM
jgi:hypothetical protein